MFALRVTNLLKLQPYEASVLHALKDEAYKKNRQALEEITNNTRLEISIISSKNSRE
jgi:hypothetical protein